jgi:hypothetical protein
MVRRMEKEKHNRSTAPSVCMGLFQRAASLSLLSSLLFDLQYLHLMYQLSGAGE